MFDNRNEVISWIVGSAASVACVVVSMTWQTLPYNIGVALLGACIVAIAFAIGIYLWPDHNKPTKIKNASRTLLRLQFYGNQKFPDVVEKENVYSCYSYRTAQIGVDEVKESGDVNHLYVPPTWVIQVIFIYEVIYEKIDISFPSNNSITAQVYQNTPRSLFVVINNDIPHEQLEIKTRRIEK